RRSWSSSRWSRSRRSSRAEGPIPDRVPCPPLRAGGAPPYRSAVRFTRGGECSGCRFLLARVMSRANEESRSHPADPDRRRTGGGAPRGRGQARPAAQSAAPRRVALPGTGGRPVRPRPPRPDDPPGPGRPREGAAPLDDQDHHRAGRARPGHPHPAPAGPPAAAGGPDRRGPHPGPGGPAPAGGVAGPAAGRTEPAGEDGAAGGGGDPGPAEPVLAAPPGPADQVADAPPAAAPEAEAPHDSASATPERPDRTAGGAASGGGSGGDGAAADAEGAGEAGRPPRGPAMFRSLAVRNYRLFAMGQVVSNTGTWMQRVAQDWLVLQISGGSGIALGITTALQFLPMLLLGLWGGTLVDRANKRRLLIATQAAMGVLALGRAVLATAGRAEAWHVYLFAFGLDLVTVLDNPARQTFVVEMVGRRDLPNASALNSASFQLGRVVGPAVAGLLIAAVGSGPVFLINAFSFLAVLTGMWMMR